jgi:hypothetical protein
VLVFGNGDVVCFCVCFVDDGDVVVCLLVMVMLFVCGLFFFLFICFLGLFVFFVYLFSLLFVCGLFVVCWRLFCIVCVFVYLEILFFRKRDILPSLLLALLNSSLKHHIQLLRRNHKLIPESSISLVHRFLHFTTKKMREFLKNRREVGVGMDGDVSCIIEEFCFLQEGEVVSLESLYMYDYER